VKKGGEFQIVDATIWKEREPKDRSLRETCKLAKEHDAGTWGLRSSVVWCAADAGESDEDEQMTIIVLTTVGVVTAAVAAVVIGIVILTRHRYISLVMIC